MKGIKIVGRRALIGRGFIGTALSQPGRFTDFYHSHNIHELRGDYDHIVIAAPSAEKWRANQHSALDMEAVLSIARALDQVPLTTPITLISTIDAEEEDTPYGVHRRILEEEVLDRGGHVIRLPALYGDGLRKNALYDLLHNRPVDDGQYQWCNIRQVWPAISAYAPGKITRLYSEPVTMREIADALGLKAVEWKPSTAAYNEKGPHTMTRVEALQDIMKWATSSERPAVSPPSASHQGQASQSGASPGGTCRASEPGQDGQSGAPPTQSAG